jgi:hypothetical protein
MEKLKRAMVAMAIVTTFSFVLSCTDDLAPTDDAQSAKVTDDVRKQFEKLGFDASDMKIVSDDNPLTTQSEKFYYLLEGDIRISPSLLKEMSGSDVHHVGAVGEQYRTTNLVSSPRTIRVLGYTGGSNALDATMQTALSWAVDNYNALGIGLTFTLTWGTNTGAADIVVYRTGSGAGGSAGFPSGGAPYKWVQILSGTSGYGTNVTEHVITHEIGHCVGLRHTDYFNRSLSCGSGGNEGSGGVGAHHIPGTPTGFDANSIMLSCFGSGEDGEFGNYDRVALNYLY